MSEMPKGGSKIEATLPDGRIVELTIPPGASVLDYGDKEWDEMLKVAAKDPVNTESEKRFQRTQWDPIERWTFGAKQAAKEMGYGVKDIFGKLTDEDRRDISVGRLTEKKLGLPGFVSHLAGDIGLTAAPMKAAGGMSTSLGRGPLSRTLAAYTGEGTANAGVGALKPVLGNESRTDNMEEAAMMGTAGKAAGSVLGRTIKGLVPVSKDARKLPPDVYDSATLGQIADRNTVAGRIASGTEERSKSIPIMGQFIEHAREAGVNKWRDNVLSKGTPSGFTPSGTANYRDALEEVTNEFEKRYQGMLQGTQIAPSQTFANDAGAIFKGAEHGLIPEELANLQRDVFGIYNKMYKTANGRVRMDGTDAKKFESFLSGRARAYRKAASSPINPNPKSGDIADVYEQLEEAWSNAYRNQLPVDVRTAMAPLDATYAKFKTIQRASSDLGNTEGRFTPGNLASSVKARTPLNRYSQGKGILQEDADIGKSVFTDKLPNSGSADRALAGAAVLGAAVNPVQTLGIGVPMVLGMTSGTGKKALTGDLKIQKLLQKLRIPEVAADQGGNTFRSILDAASDPETPEY